MEFINNEATLLGHFFTICLKITTVKNFKNIGFSSIDLDPQIHSVGILVVFLFFFFSYTNYNGNNAHFVWPSRKMVNDISEKSVRGYKQMVQNHWNKNNTSCPLSWCAIGSGFKFKINLSSALIDLNWEKYMSHHNN